jgi:hypothetical protein
MERTMIAIRTWVILFGVFASVLIWHAPCAQADSNDAYFNCLRQYSGFDIKNASQARYEQEIFVASRIQQQLSSGVPAPTVTARLEKDGESINIAVNQVKCVAMVMKLPESGTQPPSGPCMMPTPWGVAPCHGLPTKIP